MQNSELLPRLGARILTGDERWPNQPSAAIGPAQPFNFRSANSPLPTLGTSCRIRRGLPSGQMVVPEPERFGNAAVFVVAGAGFEPANFRLLTQRRRPVHVVCTNRVDLVLTHPVPASRKDARAGRRVGCLNRQARYFSSSSWPRAI